MRPMVLERFMELPEEIKQMYLSISASYLEELFARNRMYQENENNLHILIGLVIGVHTLVGGPTITTATAGAEPKVKKFARELNSRFSGIKKELKKIEKKRQTEQKKRIKIVKKKMAKLAKTEKKRAKEAAKKYLEKQANRTRNTFCRNEVEFITTEDIEDIPTEDLTFIKLDKSIYCLDKDSFKNVVKFAKDQKVRGSCKPKVRNKPLECKWFYPINIGQFIFISEKNYNNLNMEKRMFSLKNKRMIDFTTGLHIMSEKSGMDAVYNLVPDKYSIKEIKKSIKKSIKKKIVKKKKEEKDTIKSFSKMKLNVKQLRAECKKKGIKGYSKWKKAELQKRCLGKKQAKKQAKKSMTVKALKAECKRKGIKGYSKLKKAQLQKKCLS
jgi:hypothetical protein